MNTYIKEQRAPFVEELKDPHTANLVVGMLYTEDAQNPLPVLESLFNRVLYVRTTKPNYTLAQMITGGFYGPYNRGEYPRALARVDHNKNLQDKFNTAIDAALAGSNIIKGYTDQGLPTDPNGWRRPRMWINGEVFNDWAGGPGGHAGAMAWREKFQEAAENFTVSTSVTINTATNGPNTTASNSNQPQKLTTALTWTSYSESET